MRFDNTLNFIKQLESGHISSTHCLIVSPHESLVLACLERLQKPGREVYYNPDRATLYQALYSRSLFSKRVQILVNFSESPSKEIVALLEKRSDADLIVATPKLPNNSPLLSTFETILYQGELKGWELESMLSSWLLYTAKREGVKISDECALDLVKRCDVDVQLLFQEWRKLLTYVGEKRSISKEDIVHLAPEPTSHVLWHLNDACIKKNPKAVDLAQKLLSEGVSPIAMVRALRGQYQNLLQMQQLLKKRGEIQPHFPYLKGRILEQQVQAAQQLGDVTPSLLLIDDMECKLKSSSVDEGALIDLLILQLCR